MPVGPFTGAVFASKQQFTEADIEDFECLTVRERLGNTS